MSQVVSKILILYERVTSPNKLTEVKIRFRIQKVAQQKKLKNYTIIGGPKLWQYFPSNLELNRSE